MPEQPPMTDQPKAAAVLAGAARCDITPPVGIYARMWGAAKHDLCEGTHQPTSATVLAIKSSAEDTPLLLVSIDLCVLGTPEDEWLIRGPLVELAGGDSARVIVNCTHTHGVGFFSTKRSHLPGGEMIGPYFEKISADLCAAARQAVETVTPATLTWATGKCSLASNRDLPDPAPEKDRYVTGYNPVIPADDTLLVGRVTSDADDRIIATIVNYACHPTTLAWENRVSSPDFVGSMRQVIESDTGGALCLFLQGASGELAPRYQYVGDTSVPEQHGRQLGHAALSALYSMTRPGHQLAYEGIVESGAPLAVWKPIPFDVPRDVAATQLDVALPTRDWPSESELKAQIDASDDRTMTERLVRKLHLVQQLGSGETTSQPAWVWRVGQSLFVAQPNECYSTFQVTLREQFPDLTVIVMNVANGSIGYIYPPELADENIYPVWQSPFERDSLSVLTQSCVTAGKALLA